MFNPVKNKCFRFDCKEKITAKNVILQTKENDVGIREMIVLTSECLAVNNKPCIFPSKVNGELRVSCWKENSDAKESCATEVSDTLDLDATERSECTQGCPGVLESKSLHNFSEIEYHSMFFRHQLL